MYTKSLPHATLNIKKGIADAKTLVSTRDTSIKQ